MHSSVGTLVPANCEISQRLASWSYSTTGSPKPFVSHTPPNPFQTVEIPTGPSSDAPVALLNTWNPSLTIWTYCVRPTSPLVSGGAQLQPTPGKGIPSKFSVVPGMFGANCLVWRAASGASLCCETARGFGLASFSRPGPSGSAGITRSGSEVSLWYEWPTITFAPGSALEPGCARGTGPFTRTPIPPPVAPANTTPAPIDSAAAANTATTTTARLRTSDRFIPRSPLARVVTRSGPPPSYSSADANPPARRQSPPPRGLAAADGHADPRTGREPLTGLRLLAEHLALQALGRGLLPHLADGAVRTLDPGLRLLQRQAGQPGHDALRLEGRGGGLVDRQRERARRLAGARSAPAAEDGRRRRLRPERQGGAVREPSAAGAPAADPARRARHGAAAVPLLADRQVPRLKREGRGDRL